MNALLVGYVQTPSPSDSGVGELEAVLREKDAELQRLRETMERNEIVIMQVCSHALHCGTSIKPLRACKFNGKVSAREPKD